MTTVSACVSSRDRRSPIVRRSSQPIRRPILDFLEGELEFSRSLPPPSPPRPTLSTLPFHSCIFSYAERRRDLVGDKYAVLFVQSKVRVFTGKCAAGPN